MKGVKTAKVKLAVDDAAASKTIETVKTRLRALAAKVYKAGVTVEDKEAQLSLQRTALVGAGSALGLFFVAAKSNFTAAAAAAAAVQSANVRYSATLGVLAGQHSRNLSLAKTSAQVTAANTRYQTALNNAQLQQLKAQKIAYAELSPAQIRLSKAIQGLRDAWQKFVTTPIVASTLAKGVALLTTIIPKLVPLLRAGAAGAGRFIAAFARLVRSRGPARASCG